MKMSFNAFVLTCASLALLLGGGREATAGYIYNFQNYSSLQDGFTLSGTITTDINNGTLSTADVTAWSVTITPSVGSATTYDSTMSGFSDYANNVTVTPTAITLGSGGGLIFNDSSHYSVLFYEWVIPNSQYQYISSPYGNRNWFHYAAGDLGPDSLGGNPWIIATAEASAVPEPSTFALLSLGGIGLAIGAYRRKRTAAV